MSVHFGNYDVHSAEGQLKVTEKRSREKQVGITKPFPNKWIFILFELHRHVYKFVFQNWNGTLFF